MRKRNGAAEGSCPSTASQKKLLQCQADFDIVPEDSLRQSEEAGALVLNGRKYDCLFVPREGISVRTAFPACSKAFPPRTKVVFVGGGPEGFETVPLSGIARICGEERAADFANGRELPAYSRPQGAQSRKNVLFYTQ